MTNRDSCDSDSRSQHNPTTVKQSTNDNNLCAELDGGRQMQRPRLHVPLPRDRRVRLRLNPKEKATRVRLFESCGRVGEV